MPHVRLLSRNFSWIPEERLSTRDFGREIRDSDMSAIPTMIGPIRTTARARSRVTKMVNRIVLYTYTHAWSRETGEFSRFLSSGELAASIPRSHSADEIRFNSADFRLKD